MMLPVIALTVVVVSTSICLVVVTVVLDVIASDTTFTTVHGLSSVWIRLTVAVSPLRFRTTTSKLLVKALLVSVIVLIVASAKCCLMLGLL